MIYVYLLFVLTFWGVCTHFSFRHVSNDLRLNQYDPTTKVWECNDFIDILSLSYFVFTGCMISPIFMIIVSIMSITKGYKICCFPYFMLVETSKLDSMMSSLNSLEKRWTILGKDVPFRILERQNRAFSDGRFRQFGYIAFRFESDLLYIKMHL